MRRLDRSVRGACSWESFESYLLGKLIAVKLRTVAYISSLILIKNQAASALFV